MSEAATADCRSIGIEQIPLYQFHRTDPTGCPRGLARHARRTVKGRRKDPPHRDTGQSTSQAERGPTSPAIACRVRTATKSERRELGVDDRRVRNRNRSRSAMGADPRPREAETRGLKVGLLTADRSRRATAVTPRHRSCSHWLIAGARPRFAPDSGYGIGSTTWGGTPTSTRPAVELSPPK